MVSKYCIPHLKKSNNAHILNLSPPLSMVKLINLNYINIINNKLLFH